MRGVAGWEWVVVVMVSRGWVVVVMIRGMALARAGMVVVVIVGGGVVEVAVRVAVGCVVVVVACEVVVVWVVARRWVGCEDSGSGMVQVGRCECGVVEVWAVVVVLGRGSGSVRVRWWYMRWCW